MELRTIRVLLIEDNPGDVRLIQEMLAEVRDAQFDLACVRRLSAGLERLAAGGIDVVLLDLGLPDSLGFSTFTRVHVQAPKVPILLLTGLEDEALGVKAIREGAQDYLVKGQVSGSLLTRAIRYAIERKRGEKALRTSEANLSQAQRLSHLGSWEWNLATGEISWSDELCRMFGIAPATVDLGEAELKKAVTDRIHPDDRQRYREAVDTSVRDKTPYEIEYRIVLPDGVERIIYAQGAHTLVEDGNIHRFTGTAQDITERRRTEDEIRQRTAQLEALRKVGLELTSQLDLDTLLHSIVSRAMELLGGTSGGLYLYRPELDALEWAVSIGSNLAPIGSVLHRGEGLSGTVWETGQPHFVDDYQHWEGQAGTYEGYQFHATLGVPVRWGEEFLGVLDVLTDPPRTFSSTDAELLDLFATQAAIAIANARLYEEAQQEIAERKRAEKSVKYLAYHDALTGLPNRRLFNERLDLEIAHANRNRFKLAIMLLDLDHFKDVNDTLGHSVGDLLLKAAAQRLRGELRQSDTVARMGGDEFMLILPEIAGEEAAGTVAGKILEAFREPFEFDGHEMRITTSVGIALYPDDGKDVEVLMRNADIAMYRAKELGRDGYQHFSEQ